MILVTFKAEDVDNDMFIDTVKIYKSINDIECDDIIKHIETEFNVVNVEIMSIDS